MDETEKLVTASSVTARPKNYYGAPETISAVYGTYLADRAGAPVDVLEKLRARDLARFFHLENFAHQTLAQC